VFQWYLVWLLALVTLTQSWLTPAWLYWSWSVNSAYLETLPHPLQTRYGLRIVEYAPVFRGSSLLVGGPLPEAGVGPGRRPRRSAVRDVAP